MAVSAMNGALIVARKLPSLENIGRNSAPLKMYMNAFTWVLGEHKYYVPISDAMSLISGYYNQVLLNKWRRK